MANDNQIIIINKKGKGHGGHHGGAWKVAYADFVTAMMAFFIVMWILAQSQEVKQQVASYFKDPVGFTSKKGKYILDGGGGSQKTIMLRPEFVSSGGKGQGNAESVAQQRQQMEEVSQEIMREIAQSPDLRELMDKISITFDEQGMRIEIIKTDDVFFDIGGSTLKKAARDLIALIGKNLAKLPNKIVVEGHTDSRPYPGKGFGYSNFELSSDRANSARRALMLGGVNLNQFEEVRGFADKKLRNPKDPLDAQNRRITILVKYQ